jgi:type 1 glutamine amidotransferase
MRTPRRIASFLPLPALALAIVAAALAAVPGCGPRAAVREGLLGAASHRSSASPAAEAELPRVLVFSRTLGFRHKSIPDGIAALREIGAGRWETDATEDASAFTPGNLARYRAVVFLSTTGNVLDAGQQQALEGFVRAGGGWVGIHAAADTEYEWPWYGRLAGAWFLGHPKIQPATVRVEDRSHPSTSMLPEQWVRTDEWYSFRRNPRADVHVLATLDERTYDPERTPMGADHPVAWFHEFEGGRSWYTAGGHTAESFREPLFREHLRGGIEWAIGPARASGAPSPAVPTSTRGAASPARVALAAAALAAQSGRQGPPPAEAQSPRGSSNRTRLLLAGALIAVAVGAGALRNGVKAPLLAAAFPGLGHLSLGYRRRGLLAMAGVLGMFVTGLLVGGVDAVDSEEDAPWFIAQSLNGPIAFAADVVNQQVVKTGRAGELLPTHPPVDSLGRQAQGQHFVSSLKGIGAANEFGTLFIALGGMVNLVLVLDASRRERAPSPRA